MRVLIPDKKNITSTSSLLSATPKTKTVPFSNAINLDPDNLINNNDNSGVIRAIWCYLVL